MHFSACAVHVALLAYYRTVPRIPRAAVLFKFVQPGWYVRTSWYNARFYTFPFEACWCRLRSLLVSGDKGW